MGKAKVKMVNKLKRTHSLENEKLELTVQIADIQKEIISRNDQVTKLQEEVENINTLVKQGKIKNINLNAYISDKIITQKTSTERLIEEMRASDMIRESKTEPKKTTLKKKFTTPDVSPENKAFLKFVVASGGYENGWSKDDHKEFLRIRAKLIVESEMVEALLELLPGKTEEEIIAHEKWYQKYLDVREKHKKAIQNWRENRNKSTEVEKKKAGTVKKANKPRANVSKSSPVVSAKLKRRVEKWKVRIFQQPFGTEDEFKIDKTVEDMEKEEQQTLKEKRKKTKEMHAREKQRQIKEMIHAWKATKVQAEEAEKAEKELRRTKAQMEKAAKANKLIKRFQDQDKEIIKRKIQQRVTRPLSAFSLRKLASPT